ncbi:MAG: Gfo/Idh/MocA family oxidoreductase [Phaeodactylibacter sp.]|nr:Gfo/Idh/MocA family oxidoreductase [Phaeodactylibacter sp.]MCB9273415.1 Gfo/Idh/MocA family oxidoreductase [Lewinellaceae bacterium]
MTKTFNWGIIGPGRIAHKFAQDIGHTEHARLHAVASRSEDRARSFAGQYGASYAFGSYEEILGCPDLDAVYIASPHTGHYEHTLMCLRAGLPVLCEKPFALNANQVREMIATAREHDTFLMEALWTRFLPTTLKALELIGNGAIGQVLAVKADFGFRAPFDPQGRLYNPQLGGGSLLDIGIYPVFLALLVLGYPDTIKALAHIGTTGVDEECGMLFRYSDGRMAHLHSTIRARTKTEAFIYGEEGAIHLHTRWHEPTSMSLVSNEGRPLDFHFDWKTNGYSYEAQEVMRCLSSGLKESPAMPLRFSLSLIALLDAIRAEIGLVYPEESE